MNEQQTNPEGLVMAAPVQPVVQKKKASWWRTILWVLAMMLLVNVVMAFIAYWYFTYIAN